MTKEQNETVAALRKNTYDSEDLLKKLLQSRNVRKPLVRDSYTDNDESNEWSEAWNDVVRRRRCVASCCHARRSVCECDMCSMQLCVCFNSQTLCDGAVGRMHAPAKQQSPVLSCELLE
jgi:hypothetical protein